MIYIITAAIVLIIDQISKHIAVSALYRQSVPVIKGLLSFTYVENTGAAFGMFQGGNTVFTVLNLTIIAAIIFMIHKFRQKSILVNISAGLIIGGALGNIIDRIARGFVVDFLDIQFINFPVFNIADCAVVTGAILFALSVLTEKEEKNERS